MRPLTFDERKDLMLRAEGEDLLVFMSQVKVLGRKYRKSHLRILAALERSPKPTNLPKEYLQFLRNSFAEDGKELTPKELKRGIEKMLAKMRTRILDSGQQVPVDDAQLLS